MSDTNYSAELLENFSTYVKRLKINIPPCLIKDAIIKNQFERKTLSPSEKAALNYVDCIAFLFWYDESNLIMKHRQLYLKSNPKCIVKPEGIYDLSTMSMFSPIAALMVFYGMSSEAAYFALYQFSRLMKHNLSRYLEIFYGDAYASNLPSGGDLNYILKKDLLCRDESHDKATNIIYGVLAGQYHIDREIITDLIHQRLVALDENLDICFIRMEETRVIGITRLRKKDNYVHGKEYVSMTKRFSGFVYEIGSSRVSKKYKDLYLFDSIIEMLSYASLSKTKHVPRLNDASICMSTNGNLAVEMCSMGTLRNGINSPDSKLDVNISPFLDKNEDLWQIWFGFNSDCYTFKDNLRYQLRYKKSTNLQEKLRDFSLSCGTVNVYTWNSMLEIISNAEKSRKNNSDTPEKAPE